MRDRATRAGLGQWLGRRGGRGVERREKRNNLKGARGICPGAWEEEVVGRGSGAQAAPIREDCAD